jgi:hypothetical protein
MSITSLNAIDIANLGGNIEITANSGFTSLNVKDIIKIAVSNKTTVTIHAGIYTSLNLNDFVKIGGNLVTIVI